MLEFDSRVNDPAFCRPSISFVIEEPGWMNGILAGLKTKCYVFSPSTAQPADSIP